MTACFNYFFRDLPQHTGFAIAAGLEQLLDLVENLRFNDQDIRYLAGLGESSTSLPRVPPDLPAELLDRSGARRDGGLPV